jgi:aquaporin Z
MDGPDPDDGRQSAHEHPEASWSQRLAAESLGTGLLVFVAAGADVAARITGGEVSPAARALAPALLVTALIYAIGDVSGAHINPAVSLAFVARGLFPVRWLVPYWLAQLGGALGGSVAVAVLLGDVASGVSTPHVGPWQALGVEIVLTAVLVTVILGTADRARVVGPNAALAVGATIALAGLTAVPLEGASMNPARSMGPALLGGRLQDLWIYLVGPMIGALIAVGVTRALHGPAPRGDGDSVEAAEGRTARAG